MDVMLEPEAAKAAFSILEAMRMAPGQGGWAWAWLGGRELQGICAGLPPATKARYGLEAAGGCIVAALAFSDGPQGLPDWARAWPGPLAGIARFARANWYQEIMARLSGLAMAARGHLEAAGLAAGPSSAWRSLANSRLPERALALNAGLGSRGLNQLLIAGRPGEADRLGPGVILGLLLLPFDPEDWASPEALGRPIPGLGKDFLDPACASCAACVAACPGGALDLEGGFVREACLQHWAARLDQMPPRVEAAWGSRLYGCDSCLEACPLFRPCDQNLATKGLLGPGLPARWLAGAEDVQIKASLKGSALGLGWMPPGAWRRNALLSLRALAPFDDNRGKL
jgi:epoxyqueuosine reductase QueG